jgi:hypothetical protein
MHNGRIHHCLYCWAPLEQRASGRPSRICGSPACRRAADAERRRIQRRRAAGLQTVTRRIAEPVARGGRAPLIRRLARQLALELWPDTVPSPAEIDAVVAAMRAGLETAWKVRDVLRKGAPEGLPETVWLTLESLSQRAADGRGQADDERARMVYADAGLVADASTGAWVRRR